MSQLHDPKAVAAATGKSLTDVTVALPLILDALQAEGILTTQTAIGALATCAVECSFRPVHEYGNNAYFDKSAYGKVDPETHQRYYGRGYIQLTWKRHYQAYGDALGLDLVHHPELALQPATAAKILALYFKWGHISPMCDARNWESVRRAVNGGLNGYLAFLRYVQALERLA